MPEIYHNLGYDFFLIVVPTLECTFSSAFLCGLCGTLFVRMELLAVVSRGRGLDAEPIGTRAEQWEHARGPSARGIMKS